MTGPCLTHIAGACDGTTRDCVHQVEPAPEPEKDITERFLMSGYGDNVMLVCDWDSEIDGCKWWTPFVMGTPVVKILQEMDNHALTNHGYNPLKG